MPALPEARAIGKVREAWLALRQSGKTEDTRPPAPARAPGSLDSSLSPGDLMRNVLALAGGTGSLVAAGAALAQNGSMMDRDGWSSGWMGGYGMMGGYGGILAPIVLAAAVAALVVWFVRNKGK
jgi:hypothetical protein